MNNVLRIDFASVSNAAKNDNLPPTYNESRRPLHRAPGDESNEQTTALSDGGDGRKWRFGEVLGS